MALRSRAVLYALGSILPLVLTIVAARLALPTFVFEHLMILLVVGLAVAAGRGPAIAAAVAGAAGDNILLREPLGRPAITAARDAIDLGLFLVVAVTVGWLVDRLRRAGIEAREAAERERVAREELDRLVATVLHDLATPLGAIRGTIQFARKHSAMTGVDLTRLLARVETAAARAWSLVKSLGMPSRSAEAGWPSTAGPSISARSSNRSSGCSIGCRIDTRSPSPASHARS